jgi:hypothetical protein
MTKTSLLLLAIFAFGFGASTRSAAAIEYPWCAEYSGEDGGGGRNCGFSTLQQCMATVSGMGGGCVHNLFYDAPPDRPARAVPKHRKRSD